MTKHFDIFSCGNMREAEMLLSSNNGFLRMIRTFFAFLVFLVFPIQLLALDVKPPLIEYKKLYELTGPAGSEMRMPTDVAIGKKQRIYIVDSGNHRIQVFTQDGTHLFAFGSRGGGKGQLESPVGISTSKDGRVFVADRGNNRIQIYNSDGGFQKTIPTIVGKSTITPIDVEIDKNGDKIIVTASSPYHRVVVFDESGKVEGVWGKPGNNQGEFRYPATLAVSDEDEIFVVDVFNTRVQVLDSKGKYLVSVGSWGVTPGHLFRPKGVAIENDGQILVSDSYLGVVQLYNSDTRFNAVLGLNGKVARFDSPAGMTVDKKDRLYIAEVLADRVTVLQPRQED